MYEVVVKECCEGVVWVDIYLGYVVVLLVFLIELGNDLQ